MRANYQAYIWKHSIDGQFVAPTPNEHGWVIVDNKIDIVWMTKDPAPKPLLDLISCKTCKKCDTRCCPCKKKGFKCTDVCGCSPQECENSQDTGRYVEAEDVEDDDDDDDDD
jgi:hypothetical protein